MSAMRRDNSIEVLRIILMFAIVCWHCSICVNSGDPKVSKIIGAMPTFAVDTFVLISGWYGVSFSLRKILRLVYLGVVNSLILCIASITICGELSFQISLGWFGFSYLGLICLSPLLNGGVNSISSDDEMFKYWLAFTTLLLLSWAPFERVGVILKIPGGGSVSFITMIYMYITGRMLRRCSWIEKINRWGLISIGLWGAVMVFAILNGLTKNNSLVNMLFIGSHNNDAPLIILLSISIFMFFKGLRYNKYVEVCAKFVAPSVFSIYLLHAGSNPKVSQCIYSHFYIEGINNPCEQILSILLATICTFGACLMVDFTRRYLSFILSSAFKRRTIA